MSPHILGKNRGTPLSLLRSLNHQLLLNLLLKLIGDFRAGKLHIGNINSIKALQNICHLLRTAHL